MESFYHYKEGIKDIPKCIFGKNRKYHPCVWLTILSEEIGEIAKEICDSGFKTITRR